MKRGGHTPTERPVEFHKQPPKGNVRREVLLVLRLLIADVIVSRGAGTKVREGNYVLHLLKSCEWEPQLKVEATGSC